MAEPGGLIEEWVRIPVAGGRTLSARLWRPRAGGPVPAILDLSPYRAFDLFRPVLEPLLPWWAQQGYAVLAVDIAGSGGSTGLLGDEYLAGEIDDAAAAVGWAADQTWCDGAVGLSGLSWAAFTALRTAARRPPALKAMVLGGVSEDGWTTDVQNLGGQMYAARVDWAGVMLMFNALPPDPQQFGEGWRAAWLARLEANRPWVIPWLSHPERDGYWQAKAAPMGDLPLLLYSGWADKYATSVLRIAAGWKGPVRTIVGPWEHVTPATAARGPRIGFLQEALRWWDQWLKGRDTGVMAEPPLRYWLGEPDRKGGLERGVWRGAEWPFDPGLAAEFRTARDPVVLRPTPRGAAALSSDLYEDGPEPWPVDGLFADVAVAADLEVASAPVLTCRVSSDRPGGLLVARLLDIDPEGRAVRMTTGALNLAFHDGSGRAAPPQAGEPIEVALPFQAVAWRLKAGHRLGLSLAADGWPTLWPGRAGATLTVADVVVRLPRPGRPAPASPRFEAPVTAAGPAMAAARWLDAAQESFLPSGLTGALVRAPPPFAFHLPATGTDYRVASRFELMPTDAGRQAAAAKVYRAALERPGWSIRVNTRLVVRSAPSAFLVSWTVQASENGAGVFDRSGEARIPRGPV
ncbi:MAG: CocE/NonD family hydrolase [Phenylobacterium sp.]|uniref:CocE/NonD family hydrolase n=1 Tax=Phenylobacterium sp. TaxID=1871053 RepID=UPI001A4527E6|nr:CocE/NonD family hydrolase [Phenylobacterium sp.]MBL8771018.1 CocE/NonD family hydrolase [Phenylobacterium sp.]